MTTERIDVGTPGAREKFAEWIKDRGGVRVWRNVNLSTPGAQPIFTPANDVDGSRYPKPAWSCNAGDEVYDDLKYFRFVKQWNEVKRFHVALRRSGNGLSLKCTAASSQRIFQACDKFPGSHYRFDYETQEAVIEVPVWED